MPFSGFPMVGSRASFSIARAIRFCSRVAIFENDFFADRVNLTAYIATNQVQP